MSRASIAVEGFISNDLTVRQAGNYRVVDVTVPVTPQKQVDGRWEDAGETEWYKATFWDDHGDAVLQSCQKGSLVTITGGLKTSTYEKNGTAKVSLEITNPTLAVVVRRPKKGASSPVPAQEFTPPVYDDSTPF